MAGLDERRLAAARLWAAHRFPYLASGLFAARVTATDGLGGMASDESWRVYVDPETLSEWSVAQTGGMLVHHINHLLRDHAGRARDYGVGEAAADDWTKAADAEINDDLVAARVDLPGEVVLPQSFGQEPGRLAEEYFAALRHDDEAAGGDDEDGDDDGNDLGNDDERGDSDGQDDHDCGSGAHGQGRDWDQAADGAGLSQSESKLLRHQVAAEILRHAQGQPPGTIPEGLRRWAEQLLEPKVDWRKVLAAEVRRGIAETAGKVDYTYAKPSRRQAVMHEVIMPALRRPVPHVAVVCDTSGSMSEDLLVRALSEVEGLLRGLGMRRDRVRVISCDAAVHVVQRVSSARQVELYGGGGTDMGEGIAAAMRLRPAPSVVVVLTDGYTPWPDDPPKGAHVVVGLLGVTDWPTPPWARVVCVDDEVA